MNDEAAFTRAMQQNPADTTLRLIFADWLEEQGDPRGELIRLLHTLTQSVEVPSRKKLEERLRSLVAVGVKPVGPFWTNSIGMRFAWIPAGTFVMGSPKKERKRQKNEIQHKGTFTRGFFLAVHPMTQGYWREIIGNNPSYHQGDDLPVEQVSWDDCQTFLGQMSVREGHAYRLPTEAEWEYACRAGTTTLFYFGETISTVQVNYDGKHPYGDGEEGVDRNRTVPVGSFPANALGLHDMHGNVFEWCSDLDGDYASGDSIDPQGPLEGVRRILRGGSFRDQAKVVRSAFRLGYGPWVRVIFVGFRAAMTFTP
jgi:uncharacterized protein (TIGR02996 family)